MSDVKRELRNIAQLSISISAVKRCQGAEQLASVIGLSGWLDILDRLLFDGAKKVRGIAAESLRKISITNDKERELVFKATKSKDAAVKVAATECLKTNLKKSSRAQDIFFLQLKDSSAEVRLAAILALAESPSEEVFKALSTRLWDHDIAVRVSAALVLVTIGDNSVVNYFIECLQTSPCGTFDIPKEFIGFKNLSNRLCQAQINAEILAFIINQKNEDVIDKLALILSGSMVGTLDRSLFTVMAIIVAPLGKTKDFIQLWGDNWNNIQQVNFQIALKSAKTFCFDESCKDYVENILVKLRARSDDEQVNSTTTSV